jgi:hypothetical protein
MPTAPRISIDVAATRRRIVRLQRYVNRTLLNEAGFICPHLASCKASTRPTHQFREGTMSHLGRRFDLHIGDKPCASWWLDRSQAYPRTRTLPG